MIFFPADCSMFLTFPASLIAHNKFSQLVGPPFTIGSCYTVVLSFASVNKELYAAQNGILSLDYEPMDFKMNQISLLVEPYSTSAAERRY